MRKFMMTGIGLAGLLAGCGSNGNTTLEPTVKITSPGGGAIIGYDEDNTDVDISFTTANITLMDPGKCGTTANCGHVEVFVDANVCNDTTEPGGVLPYNGVASSSPTSAGLDYCPTFPAVTGSHTLTLELHKDDLSPILGSNGKVISDSITFVAQPNTPSVDAGVTADASSAACGTAANPIQVGPDHTFLPTDCSVTAGQTVTWVWENASHTVTSDNATPSFDSGVMATGTFQYTVPANTAAGTVIDYHCTLHGVVSAGVCSGMCATLTVH